MNFQLPAQTKEDILRKQLKKYIHTLVVLPAMLLFMGLAYLLLPMFFNGEKLSEETLFFVRGWVYASLAWQVIALCCWLAWRHLRPGTNPQAGQKYIYFNIAILCLLPLAALLIFPSLFGKELGILCLVIAGIYYLFFLLIFANINRSLRFLANPHTEQAKQATSPCPGAFHLWDMQKSLFWAPFLIMGLVMLVGVVALFMSEDAFSMQHVWHCFLGAALFSIPVAVVSWPMALPAYLTKQTETPSQLQRFVRHFAIVIDYKNPLPAQETTAFRWWLSHPGQPWPPDAENLFAQIDTTAFDWHNPDEWRIK